MGNFLESGGRLGSASPGVAVIGAPLANTVSWQRGTELGPAAILAASETLELFDDELLVETWRIGIETLPMLDLADCPSDRACLRIGEAVAGVLAKGRLPVLLGGEHTVSLPAILACRDRYPGLHVVQVDAHLDLRDRYEGSPYSHACVMRRVAEAGIPFTQVGIRSISLEEWRFVTDRGLRPWTMERIRGEADWLAAICGGIDGPVYLTIDVDGIDPSVIPATGTPEPGGLTWREILSLCRAIAARHRVVGLDCVELAPAPGLHHADYAAAKLIYRCLGYIFLKELQQHPAAARG